jgi:hypothetical protein
MYIRYYDQHKQRLEKIKKEAEAEKKRKTLTSRDGNS